MERVKQKRDLATLVAGLVFGDVNRVPPRPGVHVLYHQRETPTVVDGRVVGTVRDGTHFDVIPPAGVDWAPARDEAALLRQREEQERRRERRREREKEKWKGG